MHTGVLDGPPFPGAPDSALDLVDHQQDAVAIADAAQFLHEDGRSDNVSTFALHRFDEDCRYFFRGKRGLEELVFDEAGAAQRERFGILRTAFASAINVRVANMGDTWQHRAEATLLLRLRG